MRDRAAELRAALEPRLFHPADEPRIRLGPRRVRPRAGAAEPVVGPGPADRGRDRRPLRRPARDDRRRAALCRRSAPDALFDDAAVARSRRRRPDRLRAVRLFVQPGAVGVQQAAAAGEARPCARRRHRGRLVRAIPVRAVRRRDDRQFRLAGGADGVRLPDAADRAAVAGARDAAVATSARTCLPRTSNRSRPRWRRRSAIAPTCCWCSASSPAAFSSPSSPCICRPISPIAASRRRPAAG